MGNRTAIYLRVSKGERHTEKPASRRRAACHAYVARAKARPAFAKAHADQLAHFAKADESRKTKS